MKLTSMKCPSCGADIQIPEGKSLFFCTFCGTQIHYDDGEIRINITNQVVDVTRLKELELREQQRIREEQKQAEAEKAAEEARLKEKQKQIIWIIITVIWMLIFSIFCLAAIHQKNELNEELAVVFAVCAFLVPIVLSLFFSSVFPVSKKTTSKRPRWAICYLILFFFEICIPFIIVLNT